MSKVIKIIFIGFMYTNVCFIINCIHSYIYYSFIN
jgi:hypothetical protein